MAAYVIADIEIVDPQAYEEYRARVPATIAQYGGRYLVRGGTPETLEGEWRPRRLVVLEFASLEQVQLWYESEEYRATKALRQRAARGAVVVVEGV